MERPSLVGIQRVPLDAERGQAIADAEQHLVRRVMELMDTVTRYDGRPLPTNRIEFYAIGQRLRAVLAAATELTQLAGSALLWTVTQEHEPVVKPEYPNMIPPRAQRS